MRRWSMVWLAIAGCGPGATPPVNEQPPPGSPPPALGDRAPDPGDLPVRGDAQPPPPATDHGCPDGTTPMLERSNPGETLHSCVVPGKAYRNTPYRHGPYELDGADGRALMIGAWRDNKEDGLWRWWNARGYLRREMTYRDGVPISDASWDDDGNPINRRVGDHGVTWYPGGARHYETRKLADGTIESTTWFENGKPAKQERNRPARQEQTITEWFEGGGKRYQADYRNGRLAAWQGWSSTGRPLDGDTCVEDGDCVAAPQNVCYRCVPPYEGVTRWRQMQRIIHPPAPPAGCDPGPFPCARPPAPPAAQCRAGRCAVTAP